jgi:hypothetical protein
MVEIGLFALLPRLRRVRHGREAISLDFGLSMRSASGRASARMAAGRPLDRGVDRLPLIGWSTAFFVTDMNRSLQRSQIALRRLSVPIADSTAPLHVALCVNHFV